MRIFKGFRQLCTDLTKKVVRGGMSLENYLIMPIQRVPRYALLLKELHKVTVDSHPDKQMLAAACAQVEQKVAMIDQVDVSRIAMPTNAMDKRASAMRMSLSPKKGRMSEMLFRNSKTNLQDSSNHNSSSIPSADSPVTVSSRESKRKTISRSAARSSRMLNGSGKKTLKDSRRVSISDEAFAANMIYSGPENVADTEVQSVSSPILAEGSVKEVLEENGGLFHQRKFLLLKDKLVVMSCGSIVNTTSADSPVYLPTTVHTFPLAVLRMEKEEDDAWINSFAIRLYNVKKNDKGTLFVLDSETELNRWLNVLLEAIYDQ